ncbi:replication initiator [Naumannella halotolerans]|uniref:replication initiator n=1 Tax=Naumannella halotolerans TaxID=993414 RepID=UPI00370DAD13
MGAPVRLREVLNDTMRELAIKERVCVRPMMRRVLDRDTGSDTVVALPCGATRASACPSCAHKARVLRMQQCAEGWHRTDEPEIPDCEPDGQDHHDDDHTVGEDQTQSQDGPGPVGPGSSSSTGLAAGGRRQRSTRRRQDAGSLPRVPVENRTIGTVYQTPEGREFRPSMFLTLTLPSYGPVRDGAPIDPANYDYRRQARDTVHFAKLVDRFIQQLRRICGFKLQYFATVEPQARLAPHLHMAIRGTIPHQIIRQALAAVYHQVWWPHHDQPVYADELPVWTDAGYADPTTGELLSTWEDATDALNRPAHVLRFGKQHDSRGIIAPSPEADRAVRYLTKYLTKAVSDPLGGDGDDDHPRRLVHIARMEAELRFLPCSPGCWNWLRYGVQPDNAARGMEPGRCPKKAHDRDHLGLGGRRVLVSRKWSGKTLARHRADRASVVREALHTAGYLDPEIESMAADVTSTDGRPRYIWTDTDAPADTYARVISDLIAQRRQWRHQYDAAKQTVENRSATGPAP